MTETLKFSAVVDNEEQAIILWDDRNKMLTFLNETCTPESIIEEYLRENYSLKKGKENVLTFSFGNNSKTVNFHVLTLVREAGEIVELEIEFY